VTKGNLIRSSTYCRICQTESILSGAPSLGEKLRNNQPLGRIEVRPALKANQPFEKLLLRLSAGKFSLRGNNNLSNLSPNERYSGGPTRVTWWGGNRSRLKAGLAKKDRPDRMSQTDPDIVTNTKNKEKLGLQPNRTLQDVLCKAVTKSDEIIYQPSSPSHADPEISRCWHLRKPVLSAQDSALVHKTQDIPDFPGLNLENLKAAWAAVYMKVRKTLLSKINSLSGPVARRRTTGHRDPQDILKLRRRKITSTWLGACYSFRLNSFRFPVAFNLEKGLEGTCYAYQAEVLRT
jgi:hypothetical protein